MPTTALGSDRVRARNLISSAVIDPGAAINCLAVAELYAGPRRREEIENDMRQTGIAVLDLPNGAAAICGRAYMRYRLARTRSGGGLPRRRERYLFVLWSPFTFSYFICVREQAFVLDIKIWRDQPVVTAGGWVNGLLRHCVAERKNYEVIGDYRVQETPRRYKRV